MKNVASTDLGQQIEQGIQRFAENIPWLMKSLDELARIHPAMIGVLYNVRSDIAADYFCDSCGPGV